MRTIITSFLFIFCSIAGRAQTVQVVATDIKSSMRGLSVVNDKVIWASGSNGTVGKSIDGGTSWRWMKVKGYEKIDFRDIEAFDSSTAIIMGIDAPAYILKTTDGGATWNLVYKNETKGMFLDAMAFWNEQSGIAIGDPLDNKLFILRTFDGGTTWRSIPEANLPVVEKGEACFASSGTNIAPLTLQEAVFVTGGMRSRLFIRDNPPIDLPLLQGKETTGANSVGVKRVKKSTTIIVVGGDFTTKDSTTKNCCITTDGGLTFTTPAIAPHGYRSCVEFLQGDNWTTCGINGVDYSTDNGNTWTWISKDGFNACQKAKKGKAVFFVGNGKVGKLIIN